MNFYRVSITCLTGFELVGIVDVICVDGAWNHAHPICKCVSCSVANCLWSTQYCEIDDYGEAKCREKCPSFEVENGEVVDLQTKATISCAALHVRIGSSTRMCEGGDWDTDPPTCAPTSCSVLTCTSEQYCIVDQTGVAVCRPRCPELTISNGVVTDYHSYGTLQCNTAFYLNGETTVSCDVGGSWNTPLPACKRRCPACSYVSPAAGSRACTDTTATTSCNLGYKLFGTDTLTCLDGGVWSDTFAECLASDCDKLVCPVFTNCQIAQDGRATCSEWSFDQYTSSHVVSCYATIQYESDCESIIDSVESSLKIKHSTDTAIYEQNLLTVIISATQQVVLGNNAQAFFISDKLLKRMEKFKCQGTTLAHRNDLLTVLERYESFISGLTQFTQRDSLVQQCARIINCIIRSISHADKMAKTKLSPKMKRERWLKESGEQRVKMAKGQPARPSIFESGANAAYMRSLQAIAMRLLQHAKIPKNEL